MFERDRLKFAISLVAAEMDEYQQSFSKSLSQLIEKNAISRNEAIAVKAYELACELQESKRFGFGAALKKIESGLFLERNNVKEFFAIDSQTRHWIELELIRIKSLLNASWQSEMLDFAKVSEIELNTSNQAGYPPSLISIENLKVAREVNLLNFCLYISPVEHLPNSNLNF